MADPTNDTTPTDSPAAPVASQPAGQSPADELAAVQAMLTAAESSVSVAVAPVGPMAESSRIAEPSVQPAPTIFEQPVVHMPVAPAPTTAEAEPTTVIQPSQPMVIPAELQAAPAPPPDAAVQLAGNPAQTQNPAEVQPQPTAEPERPVTPVVTAPWGITSPTASPSLSAATVPVVAPYHPLGPVGQPVIAQMESERKRFFNPRAQLKSLAIGLTCGGVLVLVFLFALYNEQLVVSFIRPGQGSEVAPAVDASGTPADTSPKVYIPKINVDIPVVYGLTSTKADVFEDALDKGVVHYPTTVMPGQAGNAAFFGHSSNNIFNPGKYKFAFVLLHELVVGDKFYITYNSKLYTYEIISRTVVKPTQVSVLGPVEGQLATATLITCDPPGTSNNRLVVVGKQTDPAPDGSGSAPAVTVPTVTVSGKNASISDADVTLPDNGPSLFERIRKSIFH